MLCYNITKRVGKPLREVLFVSNADPFRSSLVARGAGARLAAVAGIVAGLWLAILWAVALP